LRSPRRRFVTAAGASAAIIAIAVTGGLLFMHGGHSPVASLATTPATNSPSESASVLPSAAPSKTQVVWNTGFGAGSQPNQVEAEQAFVDSYNATNTDNIHLTLRWSLPDCADCTFDNFIAAGGVADIIGPIGDQGRAGLHKYVRGLNDLIAANHTDLSAYPPALLATFKNTAGQYEGLPYDEYPAFIFYNKDLFKAAGLPDLPTQVGEKYMGQDWTWDELATIAKQLTVDVNYRKSTDAGFSPSQTRTYGFDTQWVNDLRGFATPWGAGSYVAADGKTAQIPPVWEQAWKWYYDAMWTSHFAPTDAERTAADMGTGTTVATGQVAMDLAWSWAISSFGATTDSGRPASKYANWDMGVLPSNEGVTTDPVDTDTFIIGNYSKVPDAAYKAMLAIMADPSLMTVYGGMPVDPSLQAAYFESAQAAVDRQFVDNPITWAVLNEMTKYAAAPTHQDVFPNYVQGTTDDQAFYARLQTKGGLNLDTEIARFKAKLQADFNSTG
jgi:ABC-type glycerol-3-phosphate transport system substrate-binding protein